MESVRLLSSSRVMPRLLSICEMGDTVGFVAIAENSQNVVHQKDRARGWVAQ